MGKGEVNRHRMAVVVLKGLQGGEATHRVAIVVP